MHEMSLCEGILQILQDNAKTQNYTRVHRVRVEVGQFATIEKDALHFCFEVVCRNTLAEGAALDICTAAANTWCMACGKAVVIEDRFSPCPDCGSYQLQTDGGDDIRIKDLEVN
ncbi:MAG TPA: hydrogenase maturation nickel metallochaperone HypA [Gammaproteobacteria bacterium]|jgi:hydrogenase nickel incorporation protein HypA/HybF|nr:hydrogenase maturation nickel metallochaperone HypA [Gammaproteobacteria bacterium]